MRDPRYMPERGIPDPHSPDIEWSATATALYWKRMGDPWEKAERNAFAITPERSELWARLQGIRL
jgi:hypothetical protein